MPYAGRSSAIKIKSRPRVAAYSERCSGSAPRVLHLRVSRTCRYDSLDLRDDGIAGSDIAVLFLDPDRSVEAPAAGIPVPASSGAIRGVVASLAGACRVETPGVGPVVVSGALAESSCREAAGGLFGALQRFGVPPPEATRLAGRIEQGHFFIAVRTPHSGISDRACDIFIANKAEEV